MTGFRRTHTNRPDSVVPGGRGSQANVSDTHSVVHHSVRRLLFQSSAFSDARAQFVERVVGERLVAVLVLFLISIAAFYVELCRLSKLIFLSTPNGTTVTTTVKARTTFNGSDTVNYYTLRRTASTARRLCCGLSSTWNVQRLVSHRRFRSVFN